MRATAGGTDPIQTPELTNDIVNPKLSDLSKEDQAVVQFFVKANRTNMSFSYYDGGKEIHNVSPAAARYLSAQLKVEVGLLKNGKHYVLSIGTPSAINYAPAKGVELIYHTHPNGTIYPSIFDIGWLNKNNAYNATNASSIILPLGKPAIKFNTKTTYAAPPPPLQIEE